MSNKGKIFIVSAPSGAGKSTVVDLVVQNIPELKKPISYTSRAPRTGEKNEADYFFVSSDNFKKMIEQKKFIEWANVYGNLYGTSLETVNKALSKGEYLLKDIDTQGAMQLKEILKEKTVLIFIMAPSIEELEKRIRNRASDTEEQIQLRLKTAKKEIETSIHYDHVIINDELSKTVSDLEGIIRTYMVQE